MSDLFKALWGLLSGLFWIVVAVGAVAAGIALVGSLALLGATKGGV